MSSDGFFHCSNESFSKGCGVGTFDGFVIGCCDSCFDGVFNCCTDGLLVVCCVSSIEGCYGRCFDGCTDGS